MISLRRDALRRPDAAAAASDASSDAADARATTASAGMRDYENAEIAPALPLVEAITMASLAGSAGRYGPIRLWGSVGFILANSATLSCGRAFAVTRVMPRRAATSCAEASVSPVTR